MSFLTVLLWGGVWVETTQEDFKDGWYERNIYASLRDGGTLEFVGRFDLNNDEYLDIPGSNWIIWGQSSEYTVEDTTLYYGRGGCDAADLDFDGYPEFVTTSIGEPVRVYPGTKNGPNPAKPQALGTTNYNNEGVFLADLNKDGYLDLIASVDNDNAAVFWGSNTGLSLYNVTNLPCNKTGYNPEAADLNKDGWLDVILITGDTYSGQEIYIYWGSAKGYSIYKRTSVTYGKGGLHGMSIADLNCDGWLDLVYSGNIPDSAAILWGSKNAYEPGENVDVNLYLPLSHHCFGGSSIADLDKDGYLDIVFFGNDDVPPRIYWGDQDGIDPEQYNDLSKRPEVGSSGYVADFNNDGNLDIFEYDLNGNSYFFYGPLFSQTKFLGISSHHGFSREIGNVYTRKYLEEYYSSVFDAQLDLGYVELDWVDSCPGTSKVDFFVSFGSSYDTVNNWSAWIPLNRNERYIIPQDSTNKYRYLRYKTLFEYANPVLLPLLKEVRVIYGEGEGIADEDSVLPSGYLKVTPVKGCWQISFDLKSSGPLDLAVYDCKGSRVHTLLKGNMPQKHYSLTWSGLIGNSSTPPPSGVYFVRLNGNEECQTAKLVMLH